MHSFSSLIVLLTNIVLVCVFVVALSVPFVKMSAMFDFPSILRISTILSFMHWRVLWCFIRVDFDFCVNPGFVEMEMAEELSQCNGVGSFSLHPVSWRN